MAAMRQIAVDDEVFDAIRQHAIPFEDHHPNDVLRRLLGLAKSPLKTDSEVQSRRGLLGDLILQELENEGGSSTAAHVLGVMNEILQPSKFDREKVSPGIERWKKDAHFARLALSRQGLISDKSARGIWELTGAGRSKARELLSAAERKAQ